MLSLQKIWTIPVINVIAHGDDQQGSHFTPQRVDILCYQHKEIRHKGVHHDECIVHTVVHQKVPIELKRHLTAKKVHSLLHQSVENSTE